MTNGRERKRRRRTAEATAIDPKTCGGWGCGAPTSLADLVLLRRAINEDWPVAGAMRKAIMQELRSEEPRRSLSVCRTLIAIFPANVRLIDRVAKSLGIVR